MAYKAKPPLFMDAGGLTLRVNPPSSPTAYFSLQIMEPPTFTENGDKISDGKFTQIWLSQEKGKALADLLYAQAVLDLIETP